MRKTLRPLWPYLWSHRRRLAAGMAALVMKDIAGASLPLIIRQAVDELAGGAGLRRVAGVVVFLLGVAAVKGVFQFTMRYVLIGISRDIEFDLRNDLFRHLLRLPPGFYQRQRTGDLMARATNDLNAVRMMVGPGIMYWTETSLTFVLALAVMLSFDWRLALLAVLPAPLVSAAVVFFGQRIHDRFEKIQEMFAAISSRVQENFSGVRMIRAYVQEEAELRRFASLNRDYIRENIRLARISGVFQPLLESLIGLTFLIVLWAGGMRVLEGKLSLGVFVMFSTYMGLLIWPMIALGWVINLMQRGAASMGRINQLLEEAPSIAPPARPAPVPSPIGDVEFRGVRVDYPAGIALNGVDLHIASGSIVAIAGHTGCGKSTLVSLIPRLRDPSAGQVLLGGRDLREYDPAEVRRRIALVPQETFLFSATIADNIAFGVERATPEDIHRAADIAGLAGDIAGFPEGYQTMVGERGLTLSGGQKQRAAIARAVLREPDLLILDDALSAVDTETEERILSRLTEVFRGRTVILISHRVSTIRQAERIIVLDRGAIVEQGTHLELVARGGDYADLYQKQLLEEELDAI
jgi:ATP-binding cassette subfamily B multidrug efflux pump